MERESENYEFLLKQIVRFDCSSQFDSFCGKSTVGCEVQGSCGICELQLERDSEESASVSQLFRNLDFAA